MKVPFFAQQKTEFRYAMHPIPFIHGGVLALRMKVYMEILLRYDFRRIN